MTTQSAFEQELKDFILNHPYCQDKNPTSTLDYNNDRLTIDISDPDGDYEAIRITIQYIP